MSTRNACVLATVWLVSLIGVAVWAQSPAGLPPRRTTWLLADGLGLIIVLMGLASTTGVAQSVPPKSVTMQDLTVPKERLPDGCSLKVIEPSHREVIATFPDGSQRVNFIGATPSMQPPAITANPWVGNDRRVLAWLRARVAPSGLGHPLDAWWPVPPASSVQAAKSLEEGYAATYAQSGGPDLGVWSLRFAVPPEARLDFPGKDSEAEQDRRTGRTTIHIDIGATWIVLYGDSGKCSTAIETYLKSLGK